MADPRRTRAWRVLRDQVVREEPLCWLRLPGCTTFSVTADHVLTVKDRPDLAMVRANLRGACSECNGKRNDKTIDQLAFDDAEALAFFE
jgi:5-methylcytosine-specific restriction endonuclease McrA